MAKQKHRGQHSNDPKLFTDKWIRVLNEAVADLSWLWSRGYAEKSSITIVGDRHRLNVRQRKALRRAACSDASLQYRKDHELTVGDLKEQSIVIDGYNLLITVEAGLAGGIVIHARDGTYRDIASIHGTYRRVEETMPALTMIGKTLQQLEVEKVYWLLDKPVSNSGRLKGIMYELSEQKGFDWDIELVNNPDRTLSELSNTISVSSDGWVLNHSEKWFNLHRYVVDTIPTAHILDLRGNNSIDSSAS
ncbi:MAG: DUF434 domain-containing protein [Bacteroidota bacterium]